MSKSFATLGKLVAAASHVVVIQSEIPDGDSLGSSLALEAILSDMGKKVSLYCPVEISRYLHYLNGWDRVLTDLPMGFDLTIIVDTASTMLLERAINPGNLAQLTRHPIIVIDHHLTESDLPFKHTIVNDHTCVSTGELIYDAAKSLKWPLPADACDNLAISILADSLGLTTEGTTAKSIRVLSELVENGARVGDIENRRREYMKKPAEILAYKGRLLQRIEYFLDGALAVIHIPWDEIQEYSDQYNPSVLVLDEMRLVEGVRLAVALKTYPDGKLTGKIRANPDAKVAETVAAFFGGGGHAFSAGFRVYESDVDKLKAELVGAVDKALGDFDKTR